jgi:ribosomal protein L32
MTVSEQISREIERDKARDKKRLADRRRIESLPSCPICGGRIRDGKCTGGGSMMSCGLYFKR